MSELREFHVGDIVRHFKGKLYIIEGFAQHTETNEEMVIYRQLYAPYELYTRPLKMFASKTDKKKYPELAEEQPYRMVVVSEQEDMVLVECCEWSEEEVE